MTCKRKYIITEIFLIITLVIFAKYSFGDNNDELLLKNLKQVSGTLPGHMTSEKNPITSEKVFLGKTLFYETRISIDGTVSCARCHLISFYSTDGLPKSIGHDSKINPRNAPTILNAADQISEHWIGNRLDVEDQAKQSVLGPAGFGMQSYEAVENKLKELTGYNQLFQKAFPDEKNPINIDNFAKAVGAFVRTLVTPSPYDAFIKGNMNSLTQKQKTGIRTFLDNGCITCHSSAYLGGQMYQKFGVFEPYRQYTRSENNDEGRYSVTKDENDKYVFKVPILRNVEMTSPYFHDGSVAGLRDAVKIMGKVQLAKTLTDSQIDYIVSFLQSLTGKIPDEILKAPILPMKE
jgi:cytochrome c peroxidase